ncbi:MAG: hypothetical protein WC480_03430 [Patescibacteria group bacterium]
MPLPVVAKKNGYVVFLSVLIASAVGIAVVMSLLLLGIGAINNSLVLEQSNQAKALANACAEEALGRIWLASTFTGTGSLTLGAGGCSYTVISSGDQSRVVTTSGTVGNIIRRLSISLTSINPQITVSSWRETAD